VNVIEHDSETADPLSVQLSAPGNPPKFTVPVIDCRSPLSREVTVALHDSVAPFQSIDEGPQMMLIEVPAVTVKLEDEAVALEVWYASPPYIAEMEYDPPSPG
jgi:hypothetical protein